MLPAFTAGQDGEIISLRVLSPGEVEITFESTPGTTYEIHGSRDLLGFSLLTRVQGSEGRTSVLVEHPVSRAPDRRAHAATRARSPAD